MNGLEVAEEQVFRSRRRLGADYFQTSDCAATADTLRPRATASCSGQFTVVEQVVSPECSRRVRAAERGRLTAADTSRP